MRIIACAWVAEVLRDPRSGVNASLHQLAPASPPGWPTPPQVEVYSEDSAPWVATGKLPPSVLTATKHGALIVRRGQDASEGDVLPAGNGFDATQTLIHYVARQTPTSVTRNDLAVIAEQTLRIARRVLSRALPDFVQERYPMLAGCEVGVPDDNAFSFHPARAEIEGGVVLDTLVVRLAVHDGLALGLDLPE